MKRRFRSGVRNSKSVFCWVLSLSACSRSLVAIQAHVLLQFDGSFRPPSDPGLPTSSLQCIGTAAACVTFASTPPYLPDDLPTIHDGVPVLIGGRLLEPGLIQSSAEAEYEGLLLGLERVISIFQSQDDHRDKPDLWSPQQQQQQPLTIKIQGDCKTVLDQLKEKSIPRKLENHHRRAMRIIHSLQTEFHTTVTYQHIPRERNVLCDQLCCQIRIQCAEIPAIRELQLAVEECQQQFQVVDASSDVNIREGFSLELLGLLKNNNLIPYSQRPKVVYRPLAELAKRVGAGHVLVQVGERMEQEAKMIWPQDAREARWMLQAEGVTRQIRGWQLIATRQSERKALAKQRKGRVMLERYHQKQAQDANFGNAEPAKSKITLKNRVQNCSGELGTMLAMWTDGVKCSGHESFWMHAHISPDLREALALPRL